MRFIKTKQITEKTKLFIYKTIYILTLTQSCEDWVLIKKQKKRLQTKHTKQVRL